MESCMILIEKPPTWLSLPTGLAAAAAAAGMPGEATGGKAGPLAGATADGDIGGLAGEKGADPRNPKPGKIRHQKRDSNIQLLFLGLS